MLACEKRIVSNSFLLTTIFTRLACLEISNYCRASGVAMTRIGICNSSFKFRECLRLTKRVHLLARQVAPKVKIKYLFLGHFKVTRKSVQEASLKAIGKSCKTISSFA